MAQGGVGGHERIARGEQGAALAESDPEGREVHNAGVEAIGDHLPRCPEEKDLRFPREQVHQVRERAGGIRTDRSGRFHLETDPRRTIANFRLPIAD